MSRPVRPIRTGLAPLVVVALLLTLALDAGPAVAKKRSDTTAAYDAIFENAWPADGPGGAAIVVRNGEVEYRTARGMADIERAFLGEPQLARLGLEAFDHLAEARDLLARLLAGAVAAREPGVNILIYGPVGTGKTEFCRSLAQHLGLVGSGPWSRGSQPLGQRPIDVHPSCDEPACQVRVARHAGILTAPSLGFDPFNRVARPADIKGR